MYKRNCLKDRHIKLLEEELQCLPLCPFKVKPSNCKIEDITEGIAVDFANRRIGGEVLSKGCV